MYVSPNFLLMFSKTWKAFLPCGSTSVADLVASAPKASPCSLENQCHFPASMAHLKACWAQTLTIQQKSCVLLEWHIWQWHMPMAHANDTCSQAPSRKLQADASWYKTKSLLVLGMGSEFHRMLGTASQK